MRKLVSILLSLFLVIAALPLQSTHAARMGRGAQGWWIGYQREICRDGATLAWLWDQPTFDGARSTLRLWEGSPNSGRLIGLAPMLPTKHVTSTSFVIDEAGTRQAFDVYAIRDVSWWPLLNVGASLSIEDPALALTITTTVKDCLLGDGNSILLDRGQTSVIGALDLRSPTLAIPDAQLRYRITVLPVQGSLILSNTALAVGDTFYQVDINEGRLRYASLVKTSVQDSFKYSLDGIVRVSQTRDVLGNHIEADGASFNPKISGNGGVIAFASTATNFDAQTDLGGDADVFLWLGNDSLRRVSLRPDNVDSSSASASPALSANAGQVAFASSAIDLVESGRDCPANVDDAEAHVYRREVDITPNEGLTFSPTLRQSVSSGSISSCQRGNNTSYSPAFAADGNVAFLSGADNLLSPITDTNGKVSDVFRRTLSNTTTSLLAVRPSTAITFFGVNGFSVAGTGNAERVAVAASDEFTIGDANGFDDIFVQPTRGPLAGQTITGSIGPAGVPANGSSFAPDLSRDGRWLAFESQATNLATADNNTKRDIFVRDLNSNTIRRVSTTSNGSDANGDSYMPRLSADGHWLTFASSASDLVAGDINTQTDVFLRDMLAGNTYLVSQAVHTNVLGNATSNLPSISDDGHTIAFSSDATNLVSDGAELNTDVDADVFVRYIDPERTLIISTRSNVFMPLMRR